MSPDFDASNKIRPPRPADPHSERRRSPRAKTHVPVFVYGHTDSDEPFHEEAYSSVVNQCGALLIMATSVAVGERLLLTNKLTQVEQECRVVHVGHRDGPSIEVAIEFTGQAQHFWRVTPGPHRISSLAATESPRKAL